MNGSGSGHQEGIGSETIDLLTTTTQPADAERKAKEPVRKKERGESRMSKYEHSQLSPANFHQFLMQADEIDVMNRIALDRMGWIMGGNRNESRDHVQDEKVKRTTNTFEGLVMKF